MTKRLMVVAVFAISASACAPAMQTSSSLPAVCLDVAANQTILCAPIAEQRAEAQQQEPPKKKGVPPGPGKKDFTTWMALLTMGFAALYLMAFR